MIHQYVCDKSGKIMLSIAGKIMKSFSSHLRAPHFIGIL